MLYGSEPPSRLAKLLLIGAVAYGLQEWALGGLAASTLTSSVITQLV